MQGKLLNVSSFKICLALAALFVVIFGAPSFPQEVARKFQTKPIQSLQVRIPKGSVWLGSDAEEKEYAYAIGGKAAKKWRWFDIEERRQPFIEEYFIDKYPVTQGEYYLFVKATGHRAPFISEADYIWQGFLVHPYSAVLPFIWKKGKPPQDKLDHPVVLVGVKDAQEYCQWKGMLRGARIFRLPTEDEWEKAARGVDGRYFPWGDKWDATQANTWEKGPGSTTPVNRYSESQSPYGVYEMAGNIFEWTLTPFKDRPNRHILKSCSWDDLPGFCRGAARHSRHKGSRHILIGFRCASSPLE